MNTSRNLGAFLAAASVAALILACIAAPARAADRWHVSLTPYVWATDLGVSAKLDERQIVDETISVGDLLKDLDTIFQMKLEVTHGAFGIATDVFDVTLSDRNSNATLPQNAGTADIRTDAGMTIVDAAGVYDPRGDHDGLAYLAGTRILYNRGTVDATFDTPAGPVVRSYDDNETLVDALIGIRFGKRLGHGFATQMQADASTGGTDWTWSASPSLTYAFGRFGRYGISAGYRHMEIDFADNGGLDSQMTLSGFLLGTRISF